MSNLLVVKGPNVGVKYVLAEQTSIGRASVSDIRIADGNVSRHHCDIVQKGRSFRIVDRGSKNGIQVNGEQVSEKVLLSNDEITIGPAVLLFDTDRDLKNARFSDRRVSFSAPTDETIVRLMAPEAEAPPDDGEAKVDRVEGATDLICRLSDLLSSVGLPLPEALTHILKSLLRLFHADNGCLLVWDAVSAEFVPMVTISEEEEFAVSQNVLRSVIEEKKAVLMSPGEGEAAGDELGETIAVDGDFAEPTDSALCVPLMSGDEIRGLLYLEITDPDNLLLKDVQLLQAVADLAQIAIEKSQTLDDLSKAADRKSTDEDVLIGKSAAFTEVLDQVDRVAETNSTVLLTGPTGTGKEVIAREIHRRSPRAAYPFVAVNCAAIPEGLVESELFGHERGSFTGADRMRRGLIECAHGGTLLLDEIGEMPLALQTKLLRFLQEHVITRVGGTKAIPVDVRILTATNRDLAHEVGEKHFRQDLWYRINVFEIAMPPLAERREDIHHLIDHFLRHYSVLHNRAVTGVSDEGLALLETYDWPGNIRELQNALERAVILSDGGLLEPAQFGLTPAGPPLRLARDEEETPPPDPPDDDTPVAVAPDAPARDEAMTLAKAEEICIRRALEANGWNLLQTALQLEIHRNTLRRKIDQFGLDPES